jgi:hypothetical protein
MSRAGVEEDRATVRVVFEVPEGRRRLKYNPGFGFRNSVKYVFR